MEAAAGPFGSRTSGRPPRRGLARVGELPSREHQRFRDPLHRLELDDLVMAVRAMSALVLVKTARFTESAIAAV
jgi:hypothetical protein